MFFLTLDKKKVADFIQDSNSSGLYTLHYFIENGDYDRHVKRMNHHYEMKRKLLIKHLHLRFANTLSIEDVPAGLHFLAKFQSARSYKEIDESAQLEKLEIYSMKRFILKENCTVKNSIDLVIGFANINEEDIPKAVERLYKIIC